jgi:hypothetical protein
VPRGRVRRTTRQTDRQRGICARSATAQGGQSQAAQPPTSICHAVRLTYLLHSAATPASTGPSQATPLELLAFGALLAALGISALVFRAGLWEIYQGMSPQMGPLMARSQYVISCLVCPAIFARCSGPLRLYSAWFGSEPLSRCARFRDIRSSADRVGEGGCECPRRRVLGHDVEILSVHVSASRIPKAPVRTESTLLSHEEATCTDRQHCETSQSCCCTAVAQGQEMAPPAVPATGATRR